MGNECPQCQTPIGECKMRDVFKQQPKNRDDLDLSHIKKGQYKKKPTTKDNEQSQISIGMNFGQSIIMQQPIKKQNKLQQQIPNKQKMQQSDLIKKPLTMQSALQTFQIKKGVQYSGGAVEKQPHERGKVTWEDGTNLSGQFFLGQLAQNQKIYISMSDGSIYDGEIYQGRANGKGKLTLPNGTFIEGTWKNDEINGFAKHKMLDNQFYEGNFVKGVKSGKGKLYFDEGMYEGLFEGDQFHGQGILVLNEGRTIKGTWKNGLLTGKAQMQWESGDKFVGNFIKDMRQGQGTYYFSDGRQWHGQWQKDLQNGFGSYQVKGQMIKSVWVSGIKKDELREVDNRV